MTSWICLWNHGFGCRHTLRMISWIHDQNPWCGHHGIKSWMLIMDPWKPHRGIIQDYTINETRYCEYTNRSITILFGDHANGSCGPNEPRFTPLWRRIAATKPICTEKGILRESSVNLRDQIIKHHVLTSEIEKNRWFWSRNRALCG